MRVNIVGPYPPPYGGISIHIKRIKQYLEGLDIDCFVYNENNFFSKKNNKISNFIFYIFKVPFLKGNIIHFHTISFKVRIILFVYKFFRKKVILTLHGESLINQYNQSSFIKRKLLVYSIGKIDKVICVNSHIKEFLNNQGIKNKKLIVMPAYIDPITNINDFNKIPNEVWNFVNQSKFLITANGTIKFFNTQDLYGIDMLINLVKNIREKEYDVSLFFALLGINNLNEKEKKYYCTLKQKIIKFGLADYIYLYEVYDTEFYPILEKSQIFLRPTNTDGDAISIREAIYYNVPTVASDIVERPKETILFKTRNQNDLESKVIDIINNYETYKHKISMIKSSNYADQLVTLYKNI